LVNRSLDIQRMEKDIRWHQRLSNYSKALKQLESAVQLSKERELTDLEEQGLIQAFEFVHELAWKTMKDFLNTRGNTEIYGSKDATRSVFQLGLIEDGEGWMDMIKSRYESSHTYNLEIAESISEKVRNRFFNLFVQFERKMYGLKSKEE